ncbi:uncharacterized TPR repeat-containing protein At2g32450-like [Coffea arabica]|uniref:Uncharacterized TPR repeat-containing protein At2g32450-like n=1 Tax=Coffea arabica TaxID=13443 RepID=A0ABM4VX23_COFAR
MGRTDLAFPTKLTTTDTRLEKVKRIFQVFDLNKDGCLNRDEMAALVVAVNPRVKFSNDQLDAINNELFLTYAPFIHGEKGLTIEGLLCTYDDGAGDIDRDFDALGLDLNTPVPDALGGSSKPTTIRTRLEKVKRIFHRFDANADGGLNRDEMAALVVATNPMVKFSTDQIDAMANEVFRTYPQFIRGEKGLTLEGLLCTYDDGAGDMDRDFDTLGLDLNTPVPDAVGGSSKPTTIRTRLEMVKRIFHRFDANRDGGLNRDEVAALVVATNPMVKFSAYEIDAMSNEAFRSYARFIHGEKGLTLEGLLISYDDGAGDIDRDFDVLGLDLNHTVVFHETYKFLDDLDILIGKLKKQKQAKDGKIKKIGNNSDKISQPQMSDKKVNWEESGQNYTVFVKDLVDLRSRADKNGSREEAFDRHMAIGRVIYDYRLHNEALISFRRALELQPTNVVAHFRAGNCLYELGRHGEAKEEFLLALEASEVNFRDWEYLIPQIHVNLGLVLENEGMVFNACDHYREAVILCPTHFRALKRLGSALVAVGEYGAGVVALEEAVFLNRAYVDAFYDLASALVAMGDEERAIMEFYKVLELKPGHVDALYNLGELFMDTGRYPRAFEMYTRVLAELPNHWKAQLSMAVYLFGKNEIEEAKQALKEGLKMVNGVELHDRLAYLKQLKKKRLKGKEGGFGEGAYIIVEPSKFRMADDSTTLGLELANALHIRAFQRTTGLSRCDVDLIKKQINEYSLPDSDSGSIFAERSIRKASLEGILRELLSFLKPETFVGSVKAINKKILSVFDEVYTGNIDRDLFFAVIAPLCSGPLERRKRVAYHALLCRPGHEGSSKIKRSDAQKYIKLLRAIYIPSFGVNDILEIDDTDESMVSLTEFLAIFDDPDRGFGIMSTLLKLETGKRNGSYVCATCRSAIIGSRFKEMESHFSLCGHCYSEGKVPSTSEQEEYVFREYAN